MSVALRGDWSELGQPPNFSFTDEIKDIDARERFILHYVTREETEKVKMPGSTEYFFLDIKRFNKSLENLSDETEKWLYLLSNSNTQRI